MSPILVRSSKDVEICKGFSSVTNDSCLMARNPNVNAAIAKATAVTDNITPKGNLDILGLLN
jgi:hypothetical protein